MLTKKELMKMSKKELEIEENIGWNYFKKVKAILKFMEIED